MIFFLLLIIIAFVTSKIRINIKQIEISNIRKQFEIRYDIALEIFIFNLVKLLKINLRNKQKKNLKKILKIDNFDKKNINLSKLRILKKIKMLIKLENFNLNILIGTENTTATIYIITAISVLIPIIFVDYKINYKVNPLYNVGNRINLAIKGISEIKLVHIIYIIFILIKERYKSGRE